MTDTLRMLTDNLDISCSYDMKYGHNELKQRENITTYITIATYCPIKLTRLVLQQKYDTINKNVILFLCHVLKITVFLIRPDNQ